jgi:EpsI family protein
MFSARFLITAFTLLAGIVFLHALSHGEPVPLRQPFGQLPLAMDGWLGRDDPLEGRIVSALGVSDYVNRAYMGGGGQRVDLYVGYYQSQRTGDTIHSPKNCLPAEGWSPIESGRVWLENPGKPRVAVNRYLVEAGDDRAVVLYWYQAHGRITLSEYWAKFYLIADSIRTARSDGALVRIFAPIEKGEDSEVAQRRAVQFSQQILPILDDYIPR